VRWRAVTPPKILAPMAPALRAYSTELNHKQMRLLSRAAAVAQKLDNQAELGVALLEFLPAVVAAPKRPEGLAGGPASQVLRCKVAQVTPETRTSAPAAAEAATGGVAVHTAAPAAAADTPLAVPLSQVAAVA
jgi:hypothetical protein